MDYSLAYVLSPVVIALLGFLGVALTALVTYRVAARQSSGLIRTSEAADLWEESTKIRQELREEVTMLRERVAGAEKDAKLALHRERECESKVRSLEERIRILEAI